MQEKALIAAMVLLFLMGAMVDFTAAILSRLIDFAFIAAGLAMMWKLGSGWRTKNDALQNENRQLRETNAQLQRRVELLAPAVHEPSKRAV